PGPKHPGHVSVSKNGPADQVSAGTDGIGVRAL
ncbi:hypothetical protein A2U01_0064524, partial [Trifolium medium]|nr:hypothetical protein [Trifolium medium]